MASSRPPDRAKLCLHVSHSVVSARPLDRNRDGSKANRPSQFGHPIKIFTSRLALHGNTLPR